MLPTNGKVLLDGREIMGPGPERGVVFQEYGVFPWLTVKENIAFGLRLEANRKSEPEIQIACEKYLDLMGLAEFQNFLPNNLSGGMRQRVALARTYAVNPDFLLMDEPFGALDAQTRLAMQDLLLELQQREAKSVFLITHSVEEAIYLSSKIVLVSARPARITEVIDVPFGYPRDETLLMRKEFTELQALLRVKVMNEYQNQLQKDRNHTPTI